MNKHTIPDQAQREQALTPNASFIIQAPAGSGKTELITQRYLKLLTTVSEPEEIIAITFTNKAVAEMQARIIQSLLKAKAAPPDKAHELTTYHLAKAVLARSEQQNWSLLENPQRLKISTIDAFCFKLTQQLPIASKFGTELSITDDAFRLYSEASERLFDLLDGNETWSVALRTLCLHLDNQLERIKLLLCNMLSKRDQWLPLITKHYQQQDLRRTLETEFAQTNDQLLAELSATLPSHLEAEITAIIRYASSHLRHKDHRYDALETLTKLPPCTHQHIEQWQLIMTLFLNTSQQWRKQASAAIGFPPASAADNAHDKTNYGDWKKRYKQLMIALSDNPQRLDSFQAVASAPNNHYSNTQWQVLNALFTLLPVAAAELRLLFIQQGVVDYIENAQAALLALGQEDNPSDLALLLDHRIQHILVDEFQDTSLSQFSLLEKLTTGWEDSDGRSLFLVGDPMQSIYRFRQAEVGLFLQAKHHGIGNIRLTPLTLTANFRSTQTIIHWVNNTFSLAFPKQENIAAGVVTYSPSDAIKATEPHSKIQCYTSIDDDKRLAESQKITDLITQIQLHHPKESIAILARSRSHLTTIIQQLKTQSVPCQAVEIERLFTKQVIQDLVSLTKALLHLGDRLSWLAVLRTPWCGLSLADLTIVANSDNLALTLWENLHHNDIEQQLSEDGQRRRHHLLAAITPAVLHRGRATLRDTVEATWQRLNGPSALPNNRSMTDINSFFELLTAIEQQHSQITHALLDRQLAHLFANNDVKHDNPVQIMTIHKSKGLEFDHVFLPCLDKRPINTDKQLLIWHEYLDTAGHAHLLLAPIHEAQAREGMYDYIHRKEQEKLNFELTRLLYVAATRSKTALYLFANLNTNKEGEIKQPDKQSFLSLLWPNCHNDFSSNVLTTQKASPTEAVIEKQPHCLNRLKPSALTTSNIDQQGYQLGTDNTPSLITEAAPSPTIIGTIIHLGLQQLATYGVDWWHAQSEQEHQQYINALFWSHHQLTDTTSTQKVLRAITNTLQDDDGQWLLSPHQDHQSELNLRFQQNNLWKTVIIDRTFVDEHNQRWVIDYKTSEPDTQSIDDFLNQEANHYQEQLNTYQQALATIDDRDIKLALYFPLLPRLFSYN